MSCRALLLDVGGVFVVPHRIPVMTALNDAGIAVGNDDVELAHFCGVGTMDAAGSGADLVEQYLSGYVSSLGVLPNDQAAATEVLASVWGQASYDLWRHVLRDSVEAIALLADQGFRLGFVSNSDGTVAEALAALNICQVGPGPSVEVTCILDSSVIGIAKPNPAILRLALERLSVRAPQAAYVGDTERYDVACAVAAGISPVHFDPYEICRHRDSHRHVRSLHELLE